MQSNIDPESHTIRTYYPDFLLQRDDGHYVILEVKADNEVDDPVVQAKQDFAQQMASASAMTYHLIPSTQVTTDRYNRIWSPTSTPPPTPLLE